MVCHEWPPCVCWKPVTVTMHGPERDRVKACRRRGTGIAALLAATLAVAAVPAAAQGEFGASLTRPHAIDRGGQRRYAPYIDRIARKNRLDAALVHAVISAESGYDPQAVSPKGAMGLMQLMPATARRFGVEDPFDPVANIEAGTRYLRLLINRFRNIRLALAAYNAGENVVSRYRNTVPPYGETRRYVVRVLQFYMYYQRNGA